jgi:hypothetical protein
MAWELNLEVIVEHALWGRQGLVIKVKIRRFLIDKV